MRNAFAAEVTEMAQRDKQVVLLSGDIGNRLFDQYKEVAPDRFINCGVAEANMISVAAGLSFCGLRPIAYTIAPFITSRCFEQIKVDVCYHRAPVIIVGTGAGLSYASLGSTHHSFEDIAIMRVLPEMTVMCPADRREVRLALRQALAHDGPVYIRIGKKGEPDVHACDPELAIGRGIVLRKGKDVCFLSTGNMLAVAVECAEQLQAHGVSAGVISCPTVKPLDEHLLSQLFAELPLVCTLEEHSIIGGFGAAVAEWSKRHSDSGAGLLSFGIADEFMHETGDQEHARRQFGLTAPQVVARVLSTLSTQSGERS
ncbi:MAG TPA: transketolase C-terminal domain-containing protein [Candidatus Obscuribacterales bacterium]